MQKNWRNASEYDFGSDYPARGWAWEFLRRNPEYREDWEKVKALLGELGREYPSLTSDGWGELTRNANLHRSIIDGAKYWGLDIVFPNPEQPYHQSTQNWTQAGRRVLSLGPAWGEWDNVEYEALAFDLSLPIEGQISAAKAHLEDLQRERAANGAIELMAQGRKRTDVYSNYLRALDAEGAGVAIKNIAAELLPHVDNSTPEQPASKTISNWLNAAKKLRDGGYRTLLS